MNNRKIYVIVVVTRSINQDGEPCEPERSMFVEQIDESDYSEWVFWALNQLKEDYGETEHFELHYMGRCDTIHTTGSNQLGPRMHRN